MRHMFPAFLAGILICVAGCGKQPSRVMFVETAVDYGISIDHAAQTAGISLTEAPTFARTARPLKRSGVVSVGIVSELDYNPDDRSYREGNIQELIAFVAQHPGYMAHRNGVCATGTRLAAADGQPVYPVVSRREGRAYAGLWANCRWRLVVKTGYRPL